MTNDNEAVGAGALPDQENIAATASGEAIRALFAEMLTQGVDEIRIDYSGEDDSGSFGQAYAPEFDVELQQSILGLSEAIAEEAVHSRHFGWENNGGAQGAVIFKRVEAEGKAILTVHVEHDDRFEDSTTECDTVFEGENAADFGEGKVNMILGAMQELGIAEIHVTYSGGGDSGDTDEFTYTYADGRQFDLVRGENKALEDAIQETVERAWSPWSGWWNNDGGRGDVYFRLKSEDSGYPQVFIEHTNYFSSEESDSYTYFAQELAA